MKQFVSAVLILFVSATVSFSADLKTYKATYEKEMGNISVEHGASISKLNESYSASLRNLSDRATGAGNLDMARAVMAETERFAEDRAVTSEVARNSSPDIKQLQLAYVQNVQSLESSKARAVMALAMKYDSALAKLQTSLTKQKKLNDALAVQNERKALAVSEEVTGAKAFLMSASESSKSTSVQSSKQRTFTPFSSKTYVDDTQGWAGLDPHDNVYTFDVEQTHYRATLKIWASGDLGLSTHGSVILTSPNGESNTIHKWSPRDFKKTARSVDSYKELKPITCDLSKLVKDEGKYDVTFKYTGGGIGLVILRVELEIK